MYKVIETERLIIRPISLTDAKFIIELVNSDGWLKFIGNRNITTKADAQNYIQKTLDTPRFFYSVFELKATKVPLGLVTFLKREAQKFPDIGFAMLPAHEKQGYAFEACQAYLKELLKTNSHENIIAITNPDNHKSISLLKKLGLNFECEQIGTAENLAFFSLKTEEYPASHASSRNE